MRALPGSEFFVLLMRALPGSDFFVLLMRALPGSEFLVLLMRALLGQFFVLLMRALPHIKTCDNVKANYIIILLVQDLRAGVLLGGTY